MLVAESQVTKMVRVLSELEDKIDSMNARVPDIQKAVNSKTRAELESLKAKVVEMASAEAEQAVSKASADAKLEASQIADAAEVKLGEIKSRIDAAFDDAVDTVISSVLK